MKEECVFCKIVNGELPCHKVWEDEDILVFLSIEPVKSGHALVIPKKHYENIFDVDEEILGKMNVVCKKVGEMLKKNFESEGVNVLNASGEVAQQSVFHIHYHVIPRNKNDGLNLWFHGEINGEKKDLGEVAKKIKGEPQ